MIRFDDTEQSFHDDEAGDRMRVDRLHPSQEFYIANYVVDGERLMLELTVERRFAGNICVLITRACRFAEDRRVWLPFCRSSGCLGGAFRLLAAWATRYFSVQITAVTITDAERAPDPNCEDVASSPSAGALQALVSAFRGQRNGS